MSDKHKYTGPFFKKTSEGFELADICKECAFGDAEGCLMCPCIYFQTVEPQEAGDSDA